MRRLSLVLCAGLSLAGAPALAQSSAAPLTVGAGQAARISLNAPVRDLVVGDPAVADVSLVNDRTLVILAKKVGSTTIMAFDARGQALADRQVVVSDIPVGGVVVQRGPATAAYACGATCSPLPVAEGAAPAK